MRPTGNYVPKMRAEGRRDRKRSRAARDETMRRKRVRANKRESLEGQR